MAVYKAIAEQTAREAQASSVYMALSLWCKAKGFMNSAKWLQKASLEETVHRTMMLDFLWDMGETPAIPATKEQVCSCKSLIEVFETVLKLEQQVSGYIHGLAQTALNESNFFAFEFLRFFLTEQLDAVREATDLVAQVTAAGECPLLFDNELEV
jgi:ferritin